MDKRFIRIDGTDYYAKPAKARDGDYASYIIKKDDRTNNRFHIGVDSNGKINWWASTNDDNQKDGGSQTYERYLNIIGSSIANNLDQIL